MAKASPEHKPDAADGATPPGPRRWLDAADCAVAVLLLAGCAGLYYVTAGFDQVSDLLAQNIPPQTFPRLVLAIIAVLALALPFEHLLGTPGWRKIRDRRGSRPPRTTWLTLALLAALAAAVPYLGTVLTIFAICAVLPVLWGERRPFRIVPFALIVTALVTLVFNTVLRVHFEPGLLGPDLAGLM